MNFILLICYPAPDQGDAGIIIIYNSNQEHVMREVYIIAADTIRFGKYLNSTISELAAKTVFPCLKEAGLDKKKIQAVYFANSAWGEYRRQVCIRGQVALRSLGIDQIPITNIENACAGGSTAFHHAWLVSRADCMM